MSKLQVLAKSIMQLDHNYYIVAPASSDPIAFGSRVEFFDKKGKKIEGEVVDKDTIDLSSSVVFNGFEGLLVDVRPVTKLVIEKVKKRPRTLRHVSATPMRRS